MISAQFFLEGAITANMRLRNLLVAARKPKQALINVVRNVAGVWELNYDTEGSFVGGWESLAESTNNKRKKQGFYEEHPILYREGALKTVAIAIPKYIEDEGTWTESDRYSGNSVTGQLTINGSRAVLGISGTRVANQFGSSKPYRPLPARQFWFGGENAAVAKAARDGVEEWVESLKKAYGTGS